MKKKLKKLIDDLKGGFSLKIAFWSNVHGQTGTTSNLLAVALISTIDYKQKNIITQSHFNLNNLESPLIGTSATELREVFTDVGIDALARYIKYATLDEETVGNCCISLLNKQLNLLAGTTKNNKDIFESDMAKTIPQILTAVGLYHDLVFIDTNSGNNPLTNLVLEQADLVIVNISQNISIINDLFQNYKIDMEKSIFLIGNYDDDSRYNMHNLKRKYREFNNKNLVVIPYNVNYLDAQSEGEVIKFFLKNLDCEKDDYNYRFISGVRQTTDKIMKFVEKQKVVSEDDI